MKRALFTLLVTLLLLMVSGCQKHVDSQNENLKIVAAGYAEYDWICQILGDLKESTEIHMLLDDGMELHSFQPSAYDMVAIAEADLFVYISASDDSWVEGALKNTVNEKQIALNLVGVLGDAVKQEESEHHDEVDEHIWLSLKNARVLCKAIAESLQKLDPEGREIYSENAKNYMQQLQELDARYQKTVEESSSKTLVFCDRFAFRYLMDDYGIEYYAAFDGCSADTAASFEIIKDLSEKVVETGTGRVIVLEGSERDLADTVLAVAGVKAEIITMNAMQSVTAEQTKSMSYIGVMEENLNALETALH